MKYIFILVAFTALNAKADHGHHYGDQYAGPYYGDCVEEYTTFISDSLTVEKNCHQDDKLELRWTTQTYPELKENPRRVQYWQGNYAKDMLYKAKYLRELVNTCTGKIISQNVIEIPERYKAKYEITNPNLDTTIKESFMLVPMTIAEAQQELAEANKKCLQDN